MPQSPTTITNCIGYRLKKILFKALTFVHQACYKAAPKYLSNRLYEKHPRRTLGSKSARLLVIPHTKRKKLGGSINSVLAATHWNELPLLLRCIPDKTVSRKQLNTYLFKL